ncbi:hypothetical protein DERP_005257 [Dermatophagoides pteronyssinus]|uniref:Uncharacterized protein n=1 Tax=Dermatophagoides pteronyssinus TaxID=6956 RepID=A0ABQ8JMH6_DERPT|nr:hypothetical protein DERP_005257 [Dermatophagoides pteronyssinus]
MANNNNSDQQQQQQQQSILNPNNHSLFHPTPIHITAALNSTPTPILSSNDTYICCAYSPRCFIIQKIDV